MTGRCEACFEPFDDHKLPPVGGPNMWDKPVCRPISERTKK